MLHDKNIISIKRANQCLDTCNLLLYLNGNKVILWSADFNGWGERLHSF